MIFEETYGAITSYTSFEWDDATGTYCLPRTEEAWQLWQKAKESPEYVNRSTVELVKDLLLVCNNRMGFNDALRQRADAFVAMNKDKVNNVVVGPWTDGKKE